MRPVLYYDGDCAFCKLWIEYWKELTGDRVEYLPSEEKLEAVRLVLPDGSKLDGAAAVYRALDEAPQKRWLWWCYRKLPGFARVSEWCYRFIARHRHPFYHLTRWGWGRKVKAPRHRLVRRLFLGLLGIVYFFAFLSLFTQIPGLIGQNGIVPAQEYLALVADRVGAFRYWFAPTLAWISASSGFLQFLALAGALLSLALVAGFASAGLLFALWFFYLSLAVAGQVFLGYQWDALLLEAGFLAIFLAPFAVLPRFRKPEPEPSPAVVWLYRWLLFRLVFGSGVVKLSSGDPTWRGLTALQYHFHTQPIPTPLAWTMDHLPAAALTAMNLGVFASELLVPFLYFMPRRLRFAGAGLTALFQLFILLTGNYAFFNLLTIALCVPLLDDAFLKRFWPARNLPAPAGEAKPEHRSKRLFLAALAVLSITIGLTHLAASINPRGDWIPRPLTILASAVSPFEIVNGYGLFAVMTTTRPEIIIEGSDDERTWRDYEFKYKAGDPNRPPPWIAPLQPRLDWQMWFAALDDPRRLPWFQSFAVRLLQGSPEVLALLDKNPFPALPPKYLRAELYLYRFTTPEERARTGAWWTREDKGPYFPVVALRQGR